jgi:hypothetical protein
MVLYSGFRTLSATKPQALLMPVINVQGSTVNAYTAFKKNNDIIKSQRAEYYPGFITINTGTYIKSAIDLSTK